MYKKVRCTCIVVVLPTKSIVVLDVLVAVASSDRKVPITSEELVTTREQALPNLEIGVVGGGGVKTCSTPNPSWESLLLGLLFIL